MKHKRKKSHYETCASKFRRKGITVLKNEELANFAKFDRIVVNNTANFLKNCGGHLNEQELNRNRLQTYRELNSLADGMNCTLVWLRILYWQF